MVSSAGVRFRTPDVIVAPLAFEVPAIAPTEDTAFRVDQLALPVASEIKTFPDAGVPPDNLKVLAEILPIVTSPELSILIDSVLLVPS